MMDRDLESKLIDALAALEDGTPVEAILIRFPEDADELRPMLMTAWAASHLHIEPRPSAQARSRAAFLAQAAAMREDLKVSAAPPRRRFGLRLPLLELFSTGLVMIGLAVIGYGAMLNALPGTALYGGKLGIEALQLEMASGADERAALLARQQQERVEEVHALLDAGRDAEVSFTGEVESIGPGVWQIAGLSVQISETTNIIGPRGEGQIAAVTGQTRDGSLYADVIQFNYNVPDAPIPPKVTATPPSSGQSPFMQGIDSGQPPAVTSTPEQVFVPSPIPPTFTPTPTLTTMPPVDASGGDDSSGGDDNENDNHDDDDNVNDNSDDD
jgi:hypothetical protein